MPAAGLITIAPTTIIPLMIVNILGTESSAYFYIAYSLVSQLFLIPEAVSTSLFVEGSYDLPLRENVLKSIKFTMALLIPMVLITFFFGDKLLMLFSGDYSYQSFELIRLLALSSLFTAVIKIYTSVKKVQNDVKVINYISFINSALILVPGYIAMTRYGLTGLGYTWLISSILSCLFVVWLAVMQREVNVKTTLITIGHYIGQR